MVVLRGCCIDLESATLHSADVQRWQALEDGGGSSGRSSRRSVELTQLEPLHLKLKLEPLQLPLKIGALVLNSGALVPDSGEVLPSDLVLCLALSKVGTRLCSGSGSGDFPLASGC